MIHAELRFGTGVEALKAVVAALFALPDDLRPTRRSESENWIGKPVGDVGKFLDSLRSGPILKRRGVYFLTSSRRMAARSHAGAN